MISPFRWTVGSLFVGLLVADFLFAADVTSTWDNTTNNWTSNHWSSVSYPNNGNGGFSYDAIIGGGIVNLNQDIQLEKLTLSGNGAVSSVTSFALTLNDLFTWTGGSIRGSGAVSALGGIDLHGAGAKTLGGSRVLAGAAVLDFSGGTLTVESSGTAAPGAILDNNGTFNATDEADILLNAGLGGNLPLFTNDGVLNKSGLATTTTIDIALNNSATVNVDSGTLTLSRGGTSTGVFDVDAGATLTLSGGTHTLAPASQVIGAGTARFSGGTTNLAGTYSVAATYITDGIANFNAIATTTSLAQSGGTLAGSASLTVSAGTFSWTGGTTTGTGSTIIPAASILTISEAANKTIGGSRVITNNGTASLSGGALTMQNSAGAGPGAVFNNNNTFSVIDDADIVFQDLLGNAPIFVNAGTFTKSGSGTTTEIDVAFNNLGTVNVTSGTLALSAISTASGPFSVSAGANLSFLSGAHTYTAAATIGGGTVSFVGGTVTLAGSYSAASTTIGGASVAFNHPTNATGSVAFSSGVFSGGGRFAVNDGTFTWTGGTMNGAGTTTIASTSSLALSGAATKTLGASRILRIDGTANLSGGDLLVQSSGGAGPGAIIDNNHVFNATDNADVVFQVVTGNAPGFNNDGSFNKSGAGTTTTVGIAFTNLGAVNVNSGTLSFTNTLNNSGIIELAGGTLASASTLASTGAIRGQGAINGNIQTAGTVAPAGTSIGVLTVNGNYVQTASGQLQLGLESTSSYDRLLVNGSAILAGTIAVSHIGGFSPGSGDTFDVLNFTSLINNGYTLNLPPLDGDLTWDTSLFASSGVLFVTGGDEQLLYGDYNDDGFVDAADYITWRINEGTDAEFPNTLVEGNIGPAHYEEWRSNFGSTLSTGSIASATILAPEPEAAVLWILIGGALGCRTMRNRREAGDWGLAGQVLLSDKRRVVTDNSS